MIASTLFMGNTSLAMSVFIWNSTASCDAGMNACGYAIVAYVHEKVSAVIKNVELLATPEKAISI